MSLFGNIPPNNSPQSNSSNSVPPVLGLGIELGALLEKVEHLEKDLAKQESSCFKEISHVKENLEKDITDNTEKIKKLQDVQNDTVKKVDRIYKFGALIVAAVMFAITNWSNIKEFFLNIFN